MIGRHRRYWLLSICGVYLAAGGPPYHDGTVVQDFCLALGFGAWQPAQPYWFPPGWTAHAPDLQLRDRPGRLSAFEGWREWKEVGPAPVLAGDTVWHFKNSDGVLELRVAWLATMWRSTRDTLELLRPAALSDGFQVRGQWSADTLHGRAHAFSDLVSPESDPRANAYGIRYACDDPEGAGRAATALHRYIEEDRPDPVQRQIEIKAERARWDSL
jgi:hypothetical protein